VIVRCATGNPGKLREFQLAGARSGDFTVQTIPNLREIPAPEETGDTFGANAVEKALYYGEHTPGWLFVDDSGLEVEALGGAPGIFSARYAGPGAGDAANNRLLLEKLNGVSNRRAQFVCVIALMRDGKLVRTFRGEVKGEIILQPRGTHGFGYDPLFYYPPFAGTFGEAHAEAKMRVSHRAQALRAMFEFLRSPNLESADPHEPRP
jgi:XTP/dITP diphosphohydrolase